MSLPKELLDALKQDKKMLAAKIKELKATLTNILTESKTLAGEAVKPTTGDSDVVDAVNNLGDKIKDVSVEVNTETAFSAFIEQGKVARFDLEIQNKLKDLNTLAYSTESALSQEQISILKAQIKLLEKDNDGSMEAAEDQLDAVENLLDAANEITNAVNAQKPPTKEEAVFNSIIEQGKKTAEGLKIQEEIKSLEENLAKTSKSLDEDQIAGVKANIDLLKSGKLKTLEQMKEAREMAEQQNAALEEIAEGQYDLAKEFKSGFGQLRGKGLGGLIRMIVVGIPALLAGIVAGIGAQIISVLSRFKTVGVIFSKIGKFFAPMLKALSGGAGAIGGFLKTLPIVGNFFANLVGFAGKMFAIGQSLAKFAGPLGIAITIITGLIGGIKGAFKGFKSDGIIGMFREGIIGIFNALIGGLVKMVGSLIGGIFKLLGFEKIGEGIKTGFSDFIDGIVGHFRGMFNVIVGLFTLNTDRIKEGIGQMMDGVINTLKGIVKGIGGIIMGALGLILKAAIALFIKLPIMLIKFMLKAFKFMYFDLPIMAFKLIFKALKFMLIDLPIKLIKFLAKAWKFVYIDLPIMAFKLIFKALKFILFDLPLKLIKFLAKAFKFIYFDLPIMAFKLIFKTLKFILLDLPLKLVGFAAKILKAMFFDLPLMALKLVFDGLKFLFIGLPGMLISKVTEFFTNMVSSIGDAFKGAFGFVKKLGKASWAALKAALPGGESPKEAFMRVMGGESGGGEEKEEKENKEAIEAEGDDKAEPDVKADEAMVPQIMPERKETVEDFESRMMATVDGKEGGGEDPLLTGIPAMETIAQPAASEEGLQDSVAAMTEEGVDQVKGIAEEGTPTGLLADPAAPSPAASIAADAPKKLGFMEMMSMAKAGKFAKKAASFTPPGMLLKGASKLGGMAKDGVEKGGSMLGKFFGKKSTEMAGPELSMAQKENAELKGESDKGAGAVVAPNNSSVNNSKSSVTNTTISAPPHIDRTHTMFGKTCIGW